MFVYGKILQPQVLTEGMWCSPLQSCWQCDALRGWMLSRCRAEGCRFMWESWFGSHWAAPAGVIYQCHQPVCWYRASEQYVVLGDTSSDTSLWFLSRMLFIMTFFLSLFHASALSLCPLCVHSVNDNQPCSWCPPCWWQRGLRGDVPAHKHLLSCCCSSGDKCQSKGWCRARQRFGSTAKKKDPIFTEGYTET